MNGRTDDNVVRSLKIGNTRVVDVQHHDNGRDLRKMVLKLVADPESHDVSPGS